MVAEEASIICASDLREERSCLGLIFVNFIISEAKDGTGLINAILLSVGDSLNFLARMWLSKRHETRIRNRTEAAKKYHYTPFCFSFQIIPQDVNTTTHSFSSFKSYLKIWSNRLKTAPILNELYIR